MMTITQMEALYRDGDNFATNGTINDLPVDPYCYLE
jgi:hypothetical protein